MPTHPTVSASWPLNVAIAAAIEQARTDEVPDLGTPIDEDGPIVLDDPPVYSGQVPEGVELVSAYIVLAASAELTGRGTFRRRGNENVETIDVWTSDQSKRTALLVAGALKKLFDGRDLVVEGYGTVRGRIETPVTLADPSTRQYRAQLRYTAVSLSPNPAP